MISVSKTTSGHLDLWSKLEGHFRAERISISLGELGSAIGTGKALTVFPGYKIHFPQVSNDVVVACLHCQQLLKL